MPKPLSVHVLMDLEWRPESGGQAMCWQNLLKSAANLPGLELTLHAQGEPKAEQLSSTTRLNLHRPVFSTRTIPFLHAPAHTDMASYHPGLADALEGADVIHTTDAFFAYAKTAERVAHQRNIPLTHSVHTDTVSYSRIFARAFFKNNLGQLGEMIDDLCYISKRVGDGMARRLAQHMGQCRFVLASREEDRKTAATLIGPERAKNYRLGLDAALFTPEKRDREGLCARFGIPFDAVIVLFVGRLDEGKNVRRLINGMERAIKNGAPLFLIAAGLGPEEKTIHKKLGPRAATPGFLAPEDLSKIYASCDWLALPSSVETWSLVAEEALASGLPVIANPASGVGRFLGAEGAGLLVHEDTDEAWESVLLEACKLQDMQRLRSICRSAATAQFPSWQEALMQDFLPIWQEAATMKRSGA